MPTEGATPSPADPPASAAVPFHRTYAAVPDAVPFARSEIVSVAAEAGITPPLLEDVRLAVSEALTNIVVHAYRDAPGRGRFEATAARAGDEFWVVLSDAGSGLRARDDSPGLGLGLALMHELSDELDIVDRSLGGTEVTLRFPLGRRRRGRRRFQSRGSAGSRGSSASAMRPASPSFSTTR